MIDESEATGLLRVQVTVRAAEHPELYAELTKDETWGFAAKRFKSLATQGLLLSKRRTSDWADSPSGREAFPLASPGQHAEPAESATTHSPESPMLAALLSNSADFAIDR